MGTKNPALKINDVDS